MNGQNDPEPLEQNVVLNAPSDPGLVFAQYITSDNCGYCYSYGSPAQTKLKTAFLTGTSTFLTTVLVLATPPIPKPVTLLQFMVSAPSRNRWRSKTRLAMLPSIRLRLQHMLGLLHLKRWKYAQHSIGLSSFGDRSDNGDGTVDVSVSASYVGSGSARAVLLFTQQSQKRSAILTSMQMVAKAATVGKHGYSTTVIMPATVATQVEQVKTVNLNAGQAVKTWTVPTSLVNGGVSNMNTVAALYSTWSTTSFNADVYATSDSRWLLNLTSP